MRAIALAILSYVAMYYAIHIKHEYKTLTGFFALISIIGYICSLILLILGL